MDTLWHSTCAWGQMMAVFPPIVDFRLRDIQTCLHPANHVHQQFSAIHVCIWADIQSVMSQTDVAPGPPISAPSPMGHFRTLPHAIFQRREGCEPYILRVCSWHFPPDGTPRSTAVRFRRGVHGVSKNAALLSGLSSVTPQGCVVGCYPAVCSHQGT